MKIRNVRSMFGGRGWVAVGLAAAMAMASGGALRANPGDTWKDVQGVWLIQVTLRNCSTGAPLGPTVGSVVTFHQGGTLSETTLDETLNWQKGNHSITTGVSAFLGRAWEDSQQLTNGIDVGFDATNDPASVLFSTANFQGASPRS